MRQLAAARASSSWSAVEFGRRRRVAADLLAYMILVYLARRAQEAARRQSAPRQ